MFGFKKFGSKTTKILENKFVSKIFAKNIELKKNVNPKDFMSKMILG